MTTLLVTTKLSMPPLRLDRVPRTSLLEQLDDGLFQGNGFSRKLTLLSAPAGYGKTTLIAEWLNHCKNITGKNSEIPAKSPAPRRLLSNLPPCKVAWLSLDESDNDPALFLTYFIAALRVSDELLGKTALTSLHSPQPPPFETTLTALINDIASLATPVILVLDDYHAITNPVIHRQMAFLVDHLPQQIHLVILSREDPLLPVSRLRAREQLLEIRQEDLRFSGNETADFLKRVMGLLLSPEEISELEHCTEGWVAGLQLAAVSMKGHKDPSEFIRAFSGSSRFILDYLIDEVFEQQPPEIKDFLLKTSILERMSGALCDAVTMKTNSQKLLESIEQSNLFVVAFDQSRSWYRYHHLFAELLRHRQRSTFPGLDIDLHRRASAWFAKEGLTGEAIRHALAGQDWLQAGRLIQRFSADYLKHGEVLTIIGWFQTLPQTILTSDPKLCFDYCWPLLLAGQFDKAAPLLESLEHIAANIPAFLGEIFAAQAYLARAIGDQERMIERSRRALELLSESSVTSRGIVSMNLGLAYWHEGRMHDAEVILTEALKLASVTGNHYAVLTIQIFLGRVNAVRGNLHLAEKAFTRVIQQDEDSPIAALAYIDLATLFYEWNNLEESSQFLEKAIALCIRFKNDEFLAGCWLVSMRLRIAQGDMPSAEKAMEQALGLALAGKIPAPMTRRVEIARQYFLIHQSGITGEQNQNLADDVDGHPFYRFLGVTKALTMPPEQAGNYLRRIGELAKKNEWGYGLIAVRALQAARAENGTLALEYLTEGMKMAVENGFIRAFVEAGEKLIPLLEEMVKRGVMPDYAHRILSVMTEKGGRKAATRDLLIEPLSERELEVLGLVTAGMSNREIAEKLIISTGTVKTHIHHLCGKLEVRNRTEAVFKAKKLGLV